MRHCHPHGPHPGCRLCERYDRDPAYRAFSDATALKLGYGGPPATKVPLALLPTCPHLGAKLDKNPCGSPLHRCDLDGEACSPHSECVGADRVCSRTCTIRPWAKRSESWQTHPDVRTSHWRAADDVLAGLEPYPADRFAGQGVVIAAGGAYWPSAYVTVRMLRSVGCTLPVQVWYLGGRGERDERYERLLSPFGVACVDADAHPARAARRVVNGFEVKLFAVLNSPFESVLLLDADCYPVADVTPLFTESGFLRTGGVYWPDLPKTERWTHWEHWGVAPFGPRCGWEVGQYLVSKRTAWRQLNLAAWYDDHSDWCYGRGGVSDHGDKGPHRVAWAKLRTAPTFYSTNTRYSGVAFVHPGPDGVTPA